MKIHLRYFASLREALGLDQEALDLPQQIVTLADLRQHLIARGGVWAEALADGKILRCAINHEMVDSNARLVDNAEIAFFPPVTGG
jgi:molybdopterin synthase sulfur carrier subunit